MSKYKKQILGFLLLLVISVACFSLFSSNKAQAQFSGPATQGEVMQCANSLRFRHIAQIYCTINGASVVFRDGNPQDGNPNYKPISSSAFCSAGGGAVTGITLQGLPNGTLYDRGLMRRLDTGTPLPASIQAQVDLDYNSPGLVPPCRNIGDPGDSLTRSVQGFSNGVRIRYAWSGERLVNLAEGSSITLSRHAQVQRVYLQSVSSDCGGDRAVVLDAPESNLGDEYFISESSDPLPPILANIFQNGSCEGERFTVGVFGAPGDSDPDGGEGSGGTGETVDACYQHAGAFAWLICPGIKMMEFLANGLYDLVRTQLSFQVPRDLGGADGASNVEAAWNVFRVLVTAIVVVLMLVMVISQAIGSGLFEAYTVRKMLPRIAIGVILIQISWPMFTWLVNLVDDIGRGIASLMYAPFGGRDEMTLFSVLGNYGLGTEAAVFSWSLFIGTVIAFAIAAPLILGALLTAVIAILVALVTLIFRNILIVLCLIVSPIALVLWIVPGSGTQRYWKLWWENFTKALLMYPLIVMLIAAGAIFASVGGGAAGTPGIINFLIVLVGFFGPLFLLPKTFRWGGSIMSMAGDYVSRGGAKLNERPQKYFQARQQDWNELRKRRSFERVANKEGFSKGNPLSWYRTPLDRMKSGRYDPLKRVPGYSDIAKRSEEEYIRAGEETFQKDVSASGAKLMRIAEAIRANGGNWDQFFQEVGNGSKSYTDSETGNEINLEEELGGKVGEVEQYAAMKQAATLGSQTNWRYLDAKNEQMRDMGRQFNPDGTANKNYDPEQATKIRKFFDDNVQAIMPKMQHIYTGIGAAADADPSSIGQMHGVEVETILSRLSADVRDAKSPDAKAKAETSLTTFLQNFQAAAQNPNISLHPGGLRAVKGFLDEEGGAEFLKDINTGGIDGREVRGIPELQTAASLDVTEAAKSQLQNFKVSLSDKIDPATGFYNKDGVPPAPAQITVTPSGRTYEPNNPEGTQRTVNITRENIQGMNESNFTNWLQSQGGIDKVSNQDLTAIYNARSANVRQAGQADPVQVNVRVELEKRGMLQPPRNEPLPGGTVVIPHDEDES